MKIRVVIFDDNAKRRDGVKLLVNSMDTMECVGEFNDCRDVLQRVSSTNPDVVLMDIDMPYVNGIEGVMLIRNKYPDLKILMQTVFEDDEKVFAAICAGADGYLLKQSNPIKLMEAISEVMEGGAPMTPVVARKVLQLFSKQNKPTMQNEFDLTKREQEILELLVKGYSYKMVAEACFISYPTVNSHVTKIYSKLKVNSISGAVSLAIREGLVK
ncbi:MAG: response regulator transcription factor [Bacteroidia bacterium]